MSDYRAQENAFFGEAAITSDETNKNPTSATNGSDNNNNTMIDLFREKASSINYSVQDKLRHLSNNIPSQYPGSLRNSPSLNIDRSTTNFLSLEPSTLSRSKPHISSKPSSTQSKDSNNQSKWSKLFSKKVLQIQKQVTKQINETIRTHQCVTCGAFAPNPYRYHPFFPSERICATHNENEIIKCTACQRFGPLISSSDREEFADLHDNGRKLCPACLRTVIVDSQDVVPLWSSVIVFLDIQLGLFFTLVDANGNCGKGNLESIKFQMKSIPILIVNHDGLNDPYVRGSGHGQGNTRGLCVYEYRQIPTFLSVGSKRGGRLKEFLASKSKSSSSNIFQNVLASFNTATSSIQQHLRSSRITAILCLKCLPHDLVSSILAHEATHAWFKLHPSFDPNTPIPLQVEEGCCQLVAFLYLSYLERQYNTAGHNDKHNNHNNEDSDQPTNLKLCQYFRHCIETDTSEIYGDGFRLAAKAYSKCNSVANVLEHVVTHRCFP